MRVTRPIIIASVIAVGVIVSVLIGRQIDRRNEQIALGLRDRTRDPIIHFYKYSKYPLQDLDDAIKCLIEHHGAKLGSSAADFRSIHCTTLLSPLRASSDQLRRIDPRIGWFIIDDVTVRTDAAVLAEVKSDEAIAVVIPPPYTNGFSHALTARGDIVQITCKTKLDEPTRTLTLESYAPRTPPPAPD